MGKLILVAWPEEEIRTSGFATYAIYIVDELLLTSERLDSSPSDQLQYQHDDRNDQKDMNKTTDCLTRETKAECP